MVDFSNLASQVKDAVSNVNLTNIKETVKNIPVKDLPKMAISNPKQTAMVAVGLAATTAISSHVAKKKDQKHMQEQVMNGQEPTKRKGFMPSAHKFARVAATFGTIALAAAATKGFWANKISAEKVKATTQLLLPPGRY